MLIHLVIIHMKILFLHILKKQNFWTSIHSSDTRPKLHTVMLGWKQWVDKFNAPSEADVKLTAILCLQTDQC